MKDRPYSIRVGLMGEPWWRWVQELPVEWGALVLALSAGLEYVFPPFPGDTVTIFGAVWIAQASRPWWVVFGSVMAGSVLGAWVDVRVGRWLMDTGRQTWLHRRLRRPQTARRIEELLARFERHGSIYVALNRFLPAFRALFFVAAGMARLPTWEVLAWSAVSAAAWNAMLLVVGLSVGFSVGAISEWVSQYATVVWSVLGVLALAWGIRGMWRRRSPYDRSIEDE